MERLKHEVKKIGSLTLFFLIGFSYILLITKLFLKEYSINTYILSKAIVGSLIAAKAVAILDITPWINRFKQSPRYVSILYKTLVYTLAVIILGVIEHLLRAYHQTKALTLAFKSFIASENLYQFLAVILCISIVFLIHNIFQELDIYLGRGTLRNIFLDSAQSRLQNPTFPRDEN
ncbi:conserved hypothetical protein [Rippkaea orientalis PCC 8801]|uniref:Uncharacterized protein n=1 Tax=Rippkaea orientalis (strain PCC 8801 / RF-1) TaxID=41431 RepID=B7JUU9_RIPO1|nr:hypothetical protein [Rippkaea orientalis]ACK66801.1 conserved hypothetical protein [Rippkaea orientalis PCC 8801]